MKTFHLVLRFSDHCDSPHSVAGRLCWTTASTQIRANKSVLPPEMEVFLSYRTSDGRTRESFVPIRFLQVSTPLLGHSVLVLHSQSSSKVMNVASLEKQRTRPRKLLAVNVYMPGHSRAHTQRIPVENVTRVTRLDQGPP